MGQPGKIASPSGVQRNRENCIFSLSPFAPENLVSRDGFGRFRVSLPIIHTQAESCAYSRDSSRFPRRQRSIILSIAIGPVPSLSGHVIAYRWRSLPRVRRHRASSLQGSSSNGCCLGRSPRTNFVSRSFSAHTIWVQWTGAILYMKSIG